MRVLIYAIAAAVLLASSPASVQAAANFLTGTVTCDTTGGGIYNVTGGIAAINSNGTLTFKMVGLQPNGNYDCTLTCQWGNGDVVLVNCGSTSSEGKTSISRPGFFNPTSVCAGAVLSFEFGPETPGECYSGFGIGNAHDQ